MKLELRATPQEVMRAVEALQEFARAQNLPDRAVFGLTLALEECASNVVNHALQRDAKQTFEVKFEQDEGRMMLELRDRGPEFDPTACTEQPRPADEDICGGWGIELVRRYVDEIQYRRVDGENVLRLTKQLDRKTDGS